jgi:hypothetical protein
MAVTAFGSKLAGLYLKAGRQLPLLQVAPASHAVPSGALVA